MDKDSKDSSNLIKSNIVWLITVLVGVGVFIATVKFQSEAIASNLLINNQQQQEINSSHIKNERFLVTLEQMRDDLDEIKDDIKEIKQVIYRPIVKEENK